MALEDDLLWQARNLDLAGRYREAERLRRVWIETHTKWCSGCERQMPWSHDVEECVQNIILLDVIES